MDKKILICLDLPKYPNRPGSGIYRFQQPTCSFSKLRLHFFSSQKSEKTSPDQSGNLSELDLNKKFFETTWKSLMFATLFISFQSFHFRKRVEKYWRFTIWISFIPKIKQNKESTTISSKKQSIRPMQFALFLNLPRTIASIISIFLQTR